MYLYGSPNSDYVPEQFCHTASAVLFVSTLASFTSSRQPRSRCNAGSGASGVSGQTGRHPPPLRFTATSRDASMQYS